MYERTCAYVYLRKRYLVKAIYMQDKININIVVDTVQALARQDLYPNTFVADNSQLNSQGQGTASLATACQPGQLIHWVATPIDLQTPVCIKSITFLPAEGAVLNDVASTDMAEEAYAVNTTTSMNELDLYTWTGILPLNMQQGVAYRYRLELQIGNGIYSVLHIDTLSLIWQPACC